MCKVILIEMDKETIFSTFKNFISLAVIQLTNYLLPLIIFPYLVKHIGVDKFGVVSVCLSFMLYVIAFTDYGFSLSATKEVVAKKDDNIFLRKIYTDVTVSKLLMLLISSIVLLFLINFVEIFKQHALMYVLGIIYALGNCLTPIWLFQGLEKIRYLSFANFFGKIVTISLVFLYIKNANDYYLVVMIYGLGNVVTAFIANCILYYKFNIAPIRLSTARIKRQFYNGWHLFLNNISIVTFGSVNVLILGFFVSDLELGQYSVAERTAFVTWQLLIIFSQAIYPQICKLAQRSHEELVSFVRIVTISFGIFVFGLCTLIFFNGNIIVKFLSGHSDENTIKLLRIMSFHGFIIFLNIPVYQTLLAYNLQKYTSQLFNVAALINVLFTIVVCWFLGSTGAAFSTLIIQFIVTLSLYVLLEKKFGQYSLWR